MQAQRARKMTATFDRRNAVDDIGVDILKFDDFERRRLGGQPSCILRRHDNRTVKHFRPDPGRVSANKKGAISETDLFVV